MYLDFTIEDILNKELLYEKTNREALLIFNDFKKRRGRSFDQVFASVKQSIAAEIYLCEKYNFTMSSQDFHDVLNERGEHVEIKAYCTKYWMNEYTKKDLERYKTAKWSKAKWYILFSYDCGSYSHLLTVKIK